MGLRHKSLFDNSLNGESDWLKCSILSIVLISLQTNYGTEQLADL